jgi:broad specificity polyphosphatase/5'/3'-nucleotidase SurE
LPPEEIKGLRITRLGILEYEDNFTIKPAETSENEKSGYIYSGRPVMPLDEEKNADITAHLDGYASVTPLIYDLTNTNMLETARGWGLEL